MKWWIKAIAQSALAHVPCGVQVHEWLQLNWGELARLEGTSRFGNAAFFLRIVRDRIGLNSDVRAVEIGTGWVPAVPMALLLAGVRVDTFDITRLIRPDVFGRCQREIGRRLGALADAAGVPLELLERRFARVKDETDFARAAASLGGSYRAPWDTTRLPYGSGEVDMVFSNLVFQNVHASVLRALVAETFRVLKPGGLAVHRIGMQDEYSGVDPKRGSVDFLRYSRSGWDFLFNHSIKYCNRMRCSQFLEMFGSAGFREVSSSKVIDREMIPRLRRRGVAAEFRHLPPEDLATVGLEIVLRKPSAMPAEAPAVRRPIRNGILHPSVPLRLSDSDSHFAMASTR